jgi:lambda family phage portal protein
MVRLFLLDQYDDAELDRKKTAAMFAGFITKAAPEEPLMGEIVAAADGTGIASLEPGTLQVLLPGEDVRVSSPADVGGGYEAFQYRTLLAVSASLGLPYHLVTGDVRQANYSSLRAELVEFRRRIGQLQHGVLVHQLCRAVWRRWLETAALSGALDLDDPVAAWPVQWIPPRWDWVDPLKDIQAQVLAMEAGIPAPERAAMFSDRAAVLAHLDPLGVSADLDGTSHCAGGDRVVVVVEADEAGFGDRGRDGMEAIKGPGPTPPATTRASAAAEPTGRRQTASHRT